MLSNVRQTEFVFLNEPLVRDGCLPALLFSSLGVCKLVFHCLSLPVLTLLFHCTALANKAGLQMILC